MEVGRPRPSLQMFVFLHTTISAASIIPSRKMPGPSSALSRVIAVARILTGILFLLFGEYKVASPTFAHAGFPQYLQGYVQGSAVAFYRPVLALLLPHVVFFGYLVGIVELAIAASLILGLWVRPMSIVGTLFMLNLALATWWEPGHGVAFWRYFGAELDKIPLIFLFLIFYAGDAGVTWGLDRPGVRHD
jgi:uncharacterized membrane protein YphA (DoxX/SURF4 family)